MQQLTSDSLKSKLRLFLKGNEKAHLVYVKDVAAAATFLFHIPSSGVVEKYIVSSDEETGTTHNEVQEYVASQTQTLAHRSHVSAPIFIPYYLRLIKNGRSNRGDIVYSSKKLRAAGFRFPYGLQMGLRDALNSVLDSSSVL